MKPKKKLRLSSIKKKAWKAFSEYIRRRGSTYDWNYCFTCKAYLPWKKLQAGHLIDGRTNSILFEESGVFPQCLACNVFKRGNKIAYMQALEKKLGTSTAILLRDELQRLSKIPKQLKYKDYEQIYNLYKSKNKDLNDY